MKKPIILTIASSILFCCGCTMDYTSRVNGIPTWYWSANAKEQRAMREYYKQQDAALDNHSKTNNIQVR